MATHSFSIHL
jgi:6-phosphogluconolactonase (cycloisomerase 2 family)